MATATGHVGDLPAERGAVHRVRESIACLAHRQLSVFDGHGASMRQVRQHRHSSLDSRSERRALAMVRYRRAAVMKPLPEALWSGRPKAAATTAQSWICTSPVSYTHLTLPQNREA